MVSDKNVSPALAIFLFSAQTAFSLMNFPVTSFNDSGAGTLREAIFMSNALGGSNTIAFATGLSTITLATSLPPILNQTSLSISPVSGTQTINGGGNRAFSIDSGTISISNVHIENAFAAGGDGANGGGGGAGFGGGLFIRGGDVTLIDVSFDGCKAIGGIGGTASINTAGGGGGGMGGTGAAVNSSPGGGGGGGFGCAASNGTGGFITDPATACTTAQGGAAGAAGSTGSSGTTCTAGGNGGTGTGGNDYAGGGGGGSGGHGGNKTVGNPGCNGGDGEAGGSGGFGGGGGGGGQAGLAGSGSGGISGTAGTTAAGGSGGFGGGGGGGADGAVTIPRIEGSAGGIGGFGGGGGGGGNIWIRAARRRNFRWKWGQRIDRRCPANERRGRRRGGSRRRDLCECGYFDPPNIEPGALFRRRHTRPRDWGLRESEFRNLWKSGCGIGRDRSLYACRLHNEFQHRRNNNSFKSDRRGDRYRFRRRGGLASRQFDHQWRQHLSGEHDY